VPRKLTVVISAVGLAAGLVASGTAAHAQAQPQQQPVRAGLLTCHVASGFGFIFGTTRDVNCAFAPNSGTPQHYVGHIDSFGFDAGYTEAGLLIWEVQPPTVTLAPGTLAGTYEPRPSSTLVGERVKTNVLVGGSGNTISLLPFNLLANTNVNDAAGVAKLTLTHHPD
jgi:uncharacterized protein DUF992